MANCLGKCFHTIVRFLPTKDGLALMPSLQCFYNEGSPSVNTRYVVSHKEIPKLSSDCGV